MKHDPNEPEHRDSPSPSADSSDAADSQVSRPETGSGYPEHSTSETADEYTDSESESEPSDLQGLGRDLQHSGQEPKESAEEPLEGELVSPALMNQVVRAVTSLWAGPTPSPDTLRGFNEVDPSFAERAFKMSEETVAASNYERRALTDGDIASVKRGQWMAWTGSLVGMVFAIISVMSGHELVAAAFLTPAFFQFFGNFIRTVRNGDGPSDIGNSIES